MYINSGVLKVLDYIKENNKTSIKEVSNKLDLSERVVRYDIDIINFLFDMYGLPEIKKLPKGGLLAEESIKLSKKINEIKKLNKYTKSERISFIKAKILVEGSVNLSSLARLLKVSRTAIRGDIIAISEELKKDEIFIKDNKIIQEEEYIRKIIMKDCSKEIYESQYNRFSINDKNLMIDYFDESLINLDKKRLKSYVDNIINKLECDNPNSCRPIIIYILVSYLRIKNSHIIVNFKRENFVKTTNEYKVLKNYISELEKILGIEYGNKEIMALAEYVQGIISCKTNTYVLKNWIDIVLEIKKLVNKVSRYTGVDLTNDEPLMIGLINHINPLIYRLRNNIKLENEIYMDVIEPYEDIFDKVKLFLKDLEVLIDRQIDNSEIALITLHFLAAIERNKKISPIKKKVLLVCGGGYGTSKLIANQITDLYNVDIVDIISYSTFIQYDIDGIDTVITTLNISNEVEKEYKLPIIKVSPFLTIKDQKKLAKNFKKNGFNKNKLYKILDIVNENAIIKDENSLIDKLKSELFNKEKIENNKEKLNLIDFISLDKIEIFEGFEDWRDGIKECGNILVESGDIKKEYIKEIIDIAESYGVHFVLENKIAVPHGEVKNNVINSAISVIYSKNSVKFDGGKEAKIFFFLAAENTKDHLKSIEDITGLVNNERFFKDLELVEKKEDIYELILKHTR